MTKNNYLYESLGALINLLLYIYINIIMLVLVVFNVPMGLKVEISYLNKKERIVCSDINYHINEKKIIKAKETKKKEYINKNEN